MYTDIAGPKNSIGHSQPELLRLKVGGITDLTALLPSPPETVKCVNHFGLKNGERGERRRFGQKTSWVGTWARLCRPGVENWA